jgi:ATP-binding cassette subfamily B protein
MLWRMAAGERLRYLAALAALLGATVVGYFAPMVPAVVIDAVIRPAGDGAAPIGARLVEAVGGPDYVADHLWIPAAVLVALIALAGGLSYLKDYWSARASESMVQRLRDRLYDHLQRLPAAYHDRTETGDLVQRCTSDVETVRLFLSQQVVEIGRAALLLLLVIPFMLYLSVAMTLVALMVIPVIVGFSIFFFLKVRETFQRSDEAEGRLTAVVQENLTGIRVVRAFARQDFERDRFGARNADYRDRTFSLYRVMAVFWSASDLLCLGQTGLVLVIGAFWVRSGTLSVGALFAFLAYVNMLLWPVRQMGRILSELGKAVVSLGRIGEILDVAPEQDPPAEAQRSLPATVSGRIEFEDVRFAHDGQHPVLDGVSFSVEPGQTVALLGPSGSGKSTIVNLLLRLQDADGAAIRLDGVPIDRLPRATVRRQFGVVLQEPFLFSRSVKENIRLGHHDVAEQRVIDAAAAACIHESIQRFDHGYETLIGERGVRLSGGQRQRLAIARAMVRDPAVLVLDDALSAVDTRTEAMILDALRQRHARRTTIVIAHRLTTLRQADCILVLERGRIVQRGTHAELIDRPGLYQRLWRIQSELEEDLGRELAAPDAPAASLAR